MKIQFIILFLLLSGHLLFSQDIDRFCNSNACGDLDPNWELAGQTVVCEGEDFRLTPATSKPLDNISSYYWFIEDLRSNEVLFDTLFLDTTLLTYNYVVSDSLACTASSNVVSLQVRLVTLSPDCGGNQSCRFVAKPLTVFLKPRARFSNAPKVCVNEDIQLSNSSCHGEEYLWDFGDGTSSTEESPDKIYTTPGIYTIRLRVSNDCGDAFETRTVEVEGEPDAAFSIQSNDPEFCLPIIVDFTNNSNEFSQTVWSISPFDTNRWRFVDTNMNLITRDISIRFLQEGSYTIKLNASNTCANDDEQEEVIEIFQPISLNLQQPSGFCESTMIGSQDLNPSVIGSIDNYNWIINNGSSTTQINTASFDPIPFDQSGQIILQVDGPCGQVADTVDITIITTEEISFANNPTTICSSDASVQLNANPSGGRWQGEGQAGSALSEEGIFDPSDLNPGIYTLSYTNGSTGCEKEGSISIEVLAGVSVDLLEIDPACESLSYTPEVRYSGQIDRYTWQFQGGTPSTANTAMPGPVAFNNPDSALVIVEVEGQCGIAVDSIPVLIQAASPVAISPIDQAICAGGGPISLEVNQMGGRWLGAGVDEASGIFNPQLVGPGSYTIQYQLENGACSSSDQILLEVVASASVNTEDAIVCIDSEPIQLNANPVGGFWLGIPGLDSSGLFDPAGGNGPGNYTVNYNLVDDNNCAIRVETQLLVEDLPDIELMRNIELCLSDFDASLGTLLNYQTNPSGGSTIWSGPGIRDPNNGIFNAVSGDLDTGIYQIFLQYDRNDCTVFDSLSLRLIEARPLELDTDQQVCISEANLQLNANLSGGIWSGPGIDPATGIIDLVEAGSGGGSFNYTYNFSLGTSCAQTGQTNVEIIDLASQIETGGQQEVCEGAINATLVGASPANGFWRGPNLLDPNRGLIDLSTMTLDSVYNYEYCLESSAVADCDACKNKPFIIRSNPVAAFEIEGLACMGETFQLDNQTINGDRYNWDFGNGVQSNAENPSLSFDQQGSYTIGLVATSSFGCTSQSSEDIYITQVPTVSFDLAQDEGCAPFEVLTNNNSFGDSITQRWLIGRDTLLGAALPSYFIDGLTDDSTFAIVLEVENFCGTVQQIDSVSVRPYPLVNFGLSEDEGCSPVEVDLINTTQGNPDQFFWTFSNGQTSNELEPLAGPFTTTDTLVFTYDLELIAINECGSDTLSKQLSVFPPDVEAFIELDTLEACQPLVFEAVSNSTPGSRISWQFISPNGEEEGSQLESPIVTLDDPGLHTIVLYASGCGTDTDTAQVEILPAPEVVFSNRHFVCVGAPIHFNNLSEGISGSVWDFGDGQQSSERSPHHIFDSVGLYTITLMAFSSINNCPSTYTSTVEVVGLPTAAFNASITQGCGPLNIDFQNNSPNQEGLNFVWDFGDNTGKSFELSPSHTFSNPGNYQVRLTAFNADSCFSDTSILNVFVFPDPVSDFDLNQDTYCSRFDTLQPINNSVDGARFIWRYLGDTITNPGLTIPLDSVGTFDLELEVINDFQCSNTSKRAFTVLPSPRALLSSDQQEGCEDLRVQFNNSSEDANQYVWDFGDGNTSTAINPSHIFTEEGSYTVILKANSSSNTCPSDSNQLIINVLDKPTASFTFDKPATCGTPAEVRFNNSSLDNLDNQWDFGDGTSSDVSNPEHFYVDFGPKAVRLIVSNQQGCRDSILQLVDVFGSPLASFDFSQGQACEGDTIELFNNSTEAVQMKWEIEGQGSSQLPTPRIAYDEAGIYQVQLIAVYNDLCQDTLAKTLQVFQSPIADFSYTADFNAQILGEVQFNNLSLDADRFLWDLGDGTISADQSPYHEYLINRSIPVVLTAYNDNGGQFTCVDTSRQEVDPEWIATFFAPNALAPDLENDGVQYFKPVGVGIQEYDIKVYSPWGTIVWVSNELTKGQPAGQWDGTYNGQILPQGAYTWIATMTFNDGNKLRKVGSVTIVR